ncbi:MAG TPA: hypothetical protein VM577_07135, partial [Anaerovoracaceae bacterium]|nr:hypothetical protein [Anaerovoracaceae bacterium]
GEYTTTDASTQNVTALAYVLPINSVCNYKMRFQVRVTDGSSAYAVFEGVGTNKHGTVSAFGSPTAYTGIKSDTSPTDMSTIGGGAMHFDTGAVSAYPQIAGIAGKTILWKFWIEWWVV